MSETKEPKKETLSDFIEVNGKLISLLGGLTGLAAVAQKIPDFVKLPAPDSYFLTMIPFLLLILAINTFVEIMRNFRGFPYYGELFLFREVFFLVMFCFVWVFVKAYYPALTAILFLVAAMIGMMFILAFFFFITKTTFKMSWFDHVSQRWKDTLTNLIPLALFVSCWAAIAHFLTH